MARVRINRGQQRAAASSSAAKKRELADFREDYVECVDTALTTLSIDCSSLQTQDAIIQYVKDKVRTFTGKTSRSELIQSLRRLPMRPSKLRLSVTITHLHAQFSNADVVKSKKLKLLYSTPEEVAESLKRKKPEVCQYFQIEEGCDKSQWACKFRHACSACDSMQHGSSACKCKHRRLG